MHIRWTKSAKKNLEQIEEYITQDNPRTDIDTVLAIIKAVENLADHPAMGKTGRIFGTRELIIANTPYIVPYRVIKEQIEILRVFHSSMRWS